MRKFLNGVETNTLKVTGGTPGSGKVLTSDVSGNATWGTAGTGDVVGPASAVADDYVTFNGTTGKLVKDSGYRVIPWDYDTDSNNGVTRVRSSTVNYLVNADFEHWLNGTSVAPSGWTLAGDATVSRVTAISVGTYCAQVVFGTANTGELYQVIASATVVDYTFSCYVKRTSGTGTARLVAQDAASPFAEFASVALNTSGSLALAVLTVKPSAGTTLRFSIKSGNTTASTWQVDECQLQESKAVATTFNRTPIDDSTIDQQIWANKQFQGTWTGYGQLSTSNVGGTGTNSPNSTHQVLGSFATTVTAKTSAYTLTGADSVVTASASGGAFTLTLPTAVGITGRYYMIKKTDSSANAVTVDANGSETIDGGLTAALTNQYESITIVSDGANWVII